MYKLFLTLRYLRKRRIAYFAIAAVMLCTAMVLIVSSVMGGFLDQLKLKARGLLGDIIVDNGIASGFPLYEEFIAEISTWPEIEKATPLIYSYGILRFGESPRLNTVRVVGLRLEDVYVVNAFKESLYYETYYPGTTTLSPQQQPLLGFDPELSPAAQSDPTFRLPVLPEPYRSALETSRTQGIVDEAVPSSLSQEFAAEGAGPIPGVYDVNWNIESGPTLEGEPFPGLIVGRDMIAARKPDGRYERYESYPRGCRMTVTLVPISRSGSIDLPIKQPFRLTDDSRTGIYEIDSQHVYCDFSLLQKLLEMDAAEQIDVESGEVIGTTPPRCSQIQIKLTPGADAYAIAERLEEHYHSYMADPRYRLDLNDVQLVQFVEAKTWEQSQEHIIAPVEKERILVTILFGIISLVAAVLVLCILYMIVLQKTRDIGIVKAIGGSSGGVAAIFLLYGAAVGLVGSIIGAIGGYYFVTYINAIQELLIWLNPAWRVWDRSVYSFDAIPNTVNMLDVIQVVVFAILASTFGALLAAWRAGAMQPVEAMRYE